MGYIDSIAVGKRVAELREKKDLSVAELMESNKTLNDLTYSHILKDLEKGYMGWEKIDAEILLSIYITLAEYFGVTLDYLILGKPEIKLDINQAITVLQQNRYNGSGNWDLDPGGLITANDEPLGCFLEQEAIWIAEGILREKEAQAGLALSKERSDAQSSS